MLDWRNVATHVTFPANHFIAVVLARERFETGLDDPPPKAEDKVESRFLVQC